MNDPAFDAYRIARPHVVAAIARGREEGWLAGDLALAKAIPIEPADLAPDHPMTLCQQRLGLTEQEMLVLWTLVAFDLDPAVRHLLAHLSNDSRGITIGTLLAVVYSDRPSIGLDDLLETGALRRKALIEVDLEHRHLAMSMQRVRIADRVLELATGLLRLDSSLKDIARFDDTPPGMLAELVISPHVVTQLKSALAIDEPQLVLVQGRSGSGRRTLLGAAASTKASGAIIIEARNLSRQLDETRTQLRKVARECQLLGAVPLVRDLDALAEGSDRIHLVETAFEELIFATSTRPIARPWSRPPTLITVPPPTGEQLEKLWRRALPHADDHTLLASVYPLAPAIVLAVGTTAMRMSRGARPTAEQIETAIGLVLEHRLAGLATRMTVSQSWDDLVLPEDQGTAIVELLARIRQRNRVYEQWGFAEKVGRGRGIAALFSGPPGTGKSMAAGLLARSLRVEIFQVDLSKIVSKWIGETEKQLAELFDAAEAGHAILLFDEADALFGKRTEVKSSNDRFANQEVNFLLQRIETFGGICILTTNHETAIDEAFRRRLAVHVRFPMPEATERQKLWHALIPTKAPVRGALNLDKLAEKYVMSGGYIKNAVLRAAFLAADENTPITGAHLAKAAQLEYEAMGKLAVR
jgi:ATP-dependent 26S proteasome regulatory subunit